MATRNATKTIAKKGRKMFREEYITRHRDLIDLTKLGTKITIIGAGAIGGFTALSLAKMGFNNITVYDFDIVESENIGNQFFPTTALGKPKVEALAEMVKLFTGIDIIPMNKKVEETDTIVTSILIAAVDSMKARKMLMDIAVCDWLIDPRMGAEYAKLEVLSLINYTKASYDNYMLTLYDDETSVQERCTAKTTIYTVLLIAGQVVKAVKDIIMEKAYIQTLDWSIEHNALIAFNQLGRKL